MASLLILRRDIPDEDDQPDPVLVMTDAKTAADAEKALRSAVTAFFETADDAILAAALRDSRDDFNWGDAILYIPSHFFTRYALRIITDSDPLRADRTLHLSVNHDEHLLAGAAWRRLAKRLDL
jgi:hypothetical protein